MKNRTISITRPATALSASAFLVILLALLPAATAFGQDDPAAPDQDRAREQVQLGGGDGGQPVQARDQLRERLSACLDGENGLSEAQRARAREHLGVCLQAGVAEDDLQTLFGENGLGNMGAEFRLEIRKRVAAAAAEGLPVEPITAKAREGAMKGVGEQALLQACERMENHIRTAARIAAGAIEDGVASSEDPAVDRAAVSSMARNMWRGLNEGELDQLRTRARDRVRSEDCTIADLADAAETATQLTERERAVKIAGEALQQGYSSAEMQRIRTMVAGGAMRGGPVEEMAAAMEKCLGEGMDGARMFQQMTQAGWMGPEDAMGPGGHSPIDNAGGGPGDGGGSGGGSGDGSGGTGGTGSTGSGNR